MSPSTLHANWHILKGDLKQRYGQLTDDDLAFGEGKGEELLGRLQAKLGLGSDELDVVLTSFIEKTGAVDRIKAEAGAAVESLKETATSLANDAKSQVDVAYQQAKESVRGAYSGAEDEVRKNPRKALMIALIAGFLTGKLAFDR